MPIPRVLPLRLSGGDGGEAANEIGRKYTDMSFRFVSLWACSAKCEPRIKETFASCKASELAQAIWCSDQPQPKGELYDISSQGFKLLRV